MGPRLAASVATGAAVLLGAARASAWQEAHQIGDDATVRVDPGGGADVEHRLAWHIVRGPLKVVDLLNVDAVAVVEPDVLVSAEDGRTLGAHAARHDERTVRVSIDEPKQLMRGNFTFVVRWHEDLVAARALARDGGSWRLAWSPPVASDGFEGAHAVFEVPAAADPPVAIVADTGRVDDAAVASLHREPGLDVLELVRPHVSRGEAPVWTLRIDPGALGPADAAATPRSARSDPRPPPEPDRVREVGAGALLTALALAFGLLVHGRARAFASVCAARGVDPRALLPLSDGARATVSGVALATAVGLEATGQTTAGALLIAIATLAATLRAPHGKGVVRGPGRWLLLTPDDAFGPPARASLRTWAAAAGACAGLAGLAFAVRRFDAEAPWLVAIDAVALAPLVLTGRPSQLPPDGARSAAPWLVGAWRRLQTVASLRVRPWGRVALQASAPDELRLLVLPRAAMPGLVGVELGLGWSHTPVGWTPTPEVLARVLDGSAAATRLGRELPAATRVPGRKPEERVVRLRPREPTRRAAVALVRALAEAMTDRRADGPAWEGRERRGVTAAG